MNGKLKGNPIQELADIGDIEGYVIRTQVLGTARPGEQLLVAREVSNILAAQLENGSWGNTIVDTTGQIDRLLLYSVSPRQKAIRKARRWLLSQHVADGSVWHDLFREPTTTDRRCLRKHYTNFHPHVQPDFCCGVNRVTATCCVLQSLFSIGDDVSSNKQLASTVNRILALGNLHEGICGVGFGKHAPERVPLYPTEGLWNQAHNRVFRRDCEANPGVTICAHFFLRAIAHSKELATSALVRSALATWQAHQLDNGNFDTRYYQYSFYYALDTLRLFANHTAAKQMMLRMVPAVLRRQKRDGKWWRKNDWVSPTFTVIRTLHTFDLLDSAVEGTAIGTQQAAAPDAQARG